MIHPSLTRDPCIDVVTVSSVRLGDGSLLAVIDRDAKELFYQKENYRNDYVSIIRGFDNPP